MAAGGAVTGLADFGFGVGVAGGRENEFFDPRIDRGGEDAGPPGRGFLITSPEGSGFLTGLAMMLSLIAEGIALAGPDGSDVRPLTPWWLRC